LDCTAIDEEGEKGGEGGEEISGSMLLQTFKDYI